MAQILDRPLKVALCQLTSTDSIPENQARVSELLANISEGTDLVVFPENSLFFRLPGSTGVQALSLEDAFFSELTKLSVKRGFHVLLTTPLQTPRGTANATVWVQGDQPAKAAYEKIHLFDVDVAGHPPVRESEQFVGGSQPAVIRVKGWSLGLSICYDLRFSELFSRYARIPVDAILVPAAFLVPTGQAHWHTLLRARAIESQAFVLAPAQGGTHVGRDGQERQTYGHTLAVDPWGVVLGEVAGEAGSTLFVELDPRRLEQVRSQIPMARHRRL